jgi:hypothetical protein
VLICTIQNGAKITIYQFLDQSPCSSANRFENKYGKTGLFFPTSKHHKVPDFHSSFGKILSQLILKLI